MSNLSYEEILYDIGDCDCGCDCDDEYDEDCDCDCEDCSCDCITYEDVISLLSTKASKGTTDALAYRVTQLEETEPSGVQALGARVTTLEGTVSQQTATIATKASAQEVTALTGTVSDLSDDLEEYKDFISEKDYDGEFTLLKSRTTSAEERLDGLDADITLKASSATVTSLYNGLAQDLEDLSLDVDDLTGELDLKADSTDLVAVTTRLASAETDIDGLQAEITQKATLATITTLEGEVQDLSDDVDDLGSDVTTISNALQSKADASGLTAVQTRVSTAEQSISALQGAVSTKAETSVTDSLGTRLTTCEQDIDSLDGTISTKVSQTDYNGATIASLINQSASSVTIDADKIAFTGNEIEIGNSSASLTFHDGKFYFKIGNDEYLINSEYNRPFGAYRLYKSTQSIPSGSDTVTLLTVGGQSTYYTGLTNSLTFNSSTHKITATKAGCISIVATMNITNGTAQQLNYFQFNFLKNDETDKAIGFQTLTQNYAMNVPMAFCHTMTVSAGDTISIGVQSQDMSCTLYNIQCNVQYV